MPRTRSLAQVAEKRSRSLREVSEALVERVLPIELQALWDVLSDTSRMLRLDPMLESYVPENGDIQVGTLNRATSRLALYGSV